MTLQFVDQVWEVSILQFWESIFSETIINSQTFLWKIWNRDLSIGIMPPSQSQAAKGSELNPGELIFWRQTFHLVDINWWSSDSFDDTFNDLHDMGQQFKSAIFSKLSGSPFSLKQLILWERFQFSGIFPSATMLFASLVRCGTICCYETNIISSATPEGPVGFSFFIWEMTSQTISSVMMIQWFASLLCGFWQTLTWCVV